MAGVLGCTQPLLDERRDIDATADLLRVLSVNTVGPLNAVRACNACLKDGAKVVLISSTMGSLTTATHNLNPTYSISKVSLTSYPRKSAALTIRPD